MRQDYATFVGSATAWELQPRKAAERDVYSLQARLGVLRLKHLCTRPAEAPAYVCAACAFAAHLQQQVPLLRDGLARGDVDLAVGHVAGYPATPFAGLLLSPWRLLLELGWGPALFGSLALTAALLCGAAGAAGAWSLGREVTRAACGRLDAGCGAETAGAARAVARLLRAQHWRWYTALQRWLVQLQASVVHCVEPIHGPLELVLGFGATWRALHVAAEALAAVVAPGGRLQLAQAK